jgi:basic amino acid/polyamine antiporter, APA family
VPIGAILTCAWLMRELPRITWIRFGVWLVVGLVIYFLYSIGRSRVGQTREQPEKQSSSRI